jgi:HAD superfamily hydrolase (TIGR01509 family)
MGRTGILFDVDGTLVDTTYLHAQTWHDALRTAGIQVETARAHRAIGMGSAEILDGLVGTDRDRSHDDDIVTAHKTLYRQHWERLEPFQHAAELLRTCSQRGWLVVFATSAEEDELAALRRALAADEWIDVVVSSSDVDQAKPAPDLLHAALDMAGLDPADAVFVGDSVWDARAANRVPMTFVGVECGGTSRHELLVAGAAEVWQNPADLLANLDRSALAQASTTSPVAATPTVHQTT